MKDSNLRPNGQLQGDDRPMPNRGTGTGMNGDTYGANLNPEATNRIGGISSATKSDAPDEKPGCTSRPGC